MPSRLLVQDRGSANCEGGISGAADQSGFARTPLPLAPPPPPAVSAPHGRRLRDRATSGNSMKSPGPAWQRQPNPRSIALHV
jgi:hypothetical protein